MKHYLTDSNKYLADREKHVSISCHFRREKTDKILSDLNSDKIKVLYESKYVLCLKL